jgi:hypothetical protein
MANRSQPFRQHHIARALRAASAAGMQNPTVEVRLPTGATIVIGGAGGKSAAAAVLKPGKVRSSAPARKSRSLRGV